MCDTKENAMKHYYRTVDKISKKYTLNKIKPESPDVYATSVAHSKNNVMTKIICYSYKSPNDVPRPHISLMYFIRDLAEL